ncbi:methyltransferase [Parapoynx stagnalis nucleopolyhedrovirus]|uniref:Methyltransferase n=1 Tax=Parapoynx stagnalis nucleopolyhedrovirus TaxID=2993413 RepID=A0A9E8C0G4_9ABAC|nr:methyltransferase [Parapoynx stagnalis nucleopolyhedrovirus]
METKLNNLRNQLRKFNKRDIKRVRSQLFDRKTNNSRCWNKLQEIDKKFSICKNIDVFLDVCGGPGEFAKYVMNVNPFVKGFGITLNNNPACKYQRSLCNIKRFMQILGPNMSGNIMDKDVIFETSLLCGNVCDLVLADGAVDVSGRENEQEMLNYDLILCETQFILIALRTGGNCVLKVFDVFTQKTLNMLNNFVNHFETWGVFKPRSSRPANSEKYLICLDKLEIPKNIDETKVLEKKFLFYTKKQCNSLKMLINNLKR